MTHQDDSQELVAHIEAARTQLAEAAYDFAPAVFACSMGAEDMVVLDLIRRDRLPVSVFTLDTGRLPGETLDLIHRAETRYRIRIEVLRPTPKLLDAFLADHRSDDIFNSVDIRKACCQVRKVEPLGRALDGNKAWITGLRRTQSANRAAIAEKAWDAVNGLFKFNPLAGWSRSEVWQYIRARNVPYNPLHDDGYASIGCAPCSRAIRPGEDERAGRWWWEQDTTAECGLHPDHPALQQGDQPGDPAGRQ